MTDLVTLRKEDIPCLRGLFELRAAESNLLGRFSVNRALEFVMTGYDREMVGAYADNLVDPKICLIMLHAPDIFSEVSVAHVLLVYVAPEFRGDPAVFTDLANYAENYARLVGAAQVIGSSWVFRGARSSSSLWAKQGFEQQEVKFIKFLQ